MQRHPASGGDPAREAARSNQSGCHDPPLPDQRLAAAVLDQPVVTAVWPRALHFSRSQRSCRQHWRQPSGRLVWLSCIQGSPQHAAQVCRHRAGPAGPRRQIAGFPPRHSGYPTLPSVSRQCTARKCAESRAGSRPSD
ncbi:unknown [Bacillus thuringiensis phage MZTP02]|uniref:Uncharacterized protein n=1 Tax=Bacillus thuringiensis phage MZTP02 TaxID=311221 RepID=Q56AQ5_9CAUD|nr:unknown [Bacillus thuringiensis phage MZTP02]